MKFVAEDIGQPFESEIGRSDESYPQFPHISRVVRIEQRPVVIMRDLDAGKEYELDATKDWPYKRLEPKRQYRKGEKPAPDEARKTTPTDPGDEDLVLTALGEMEDKGLVPPPVLIGSETRATDGTLVEGMTTNQGWQTVKLPLKNGVYTDIDGDLVKSDATIHFEKTFGPDKPEHKPKAGVIERLEANSESIKLCKRLFPEIEINHLSEIEAKLTATQRAELYKAMSEEGV